MTCQLTLLQQTPFFSTFRINMDKECPFWAQKRMCNSQKCSICECDEKDIPKFWKKHQSNTEMSWSSNLEFTEPKIAFDSQPRGEDDWCEHDDSTSRDEDFIYVNLNNNRESYTAYNGTPVWNAIYQENCMLDRITKNNIDLNR